MTAALADMEPTYHLESVVRAKNELEDFEGPLALILMLLSKNKIEIRDLRISEIAGQYLAYLEEMRAMDLEVASEFVQMAAHLLYLKTRMLLTPEDAGPDELEELIASLEQLKARDAYAAVREVTPFLGKAAEYGALYHGKPPEPLPGGKEYRYCHAGWELLRALASAFRRGRSAAEEEALAAERRRRYLFPKRIVYSVADKSRELLLRLGAVGRMPLREAYAHCRSRSEAVAAFLSVLTLCSRGFVLLERRDGENGRMFSITKRRSRELR